MQLAMVAIYDNVLLYNVYNDQFYSHIVQIQLTNAALVANYILLDTVAQTRCYS